MKYEFYEGEVAKFPMNKRDIIPWKNYWIKVIDFRILNEEYKVLEWLWRLSWPLIRKVVEGLEWVKSWESNHYNFWTDDGIYIYTRWKNYKDLEQAWKTYWRKAFTKELVPLEFDDIYNLMKDFLTEIDAWEKRTGREKPWW